MKRIEIVVTPDGETSLETKGFTGDACRWAGLFLETALGQKLWDRPTSEAFSYAENDCINQST